MVSRAELRVRRRLRDQETGVEPDRADRALLVWAQFLLWMYAERPSACPMCVGQEVVEEV